MSKLKEGGESSAIGMGERSKEERGKVEGWRLKVESKEDDRRGDGANICNRADVSHLTFRISNLSSHGKRQGRRQQEVGGREVDDRSDELRIECECDMEVGGGEKKEKQNREEEEEEEEEERSRGEAEEWSNRLGLPSLAQLVEQEDECQGSKGA
jgi:hypothetical protein